jgi:hypothetical protein
MMLTAIAILVWLYAAWAAWWDLRDTEIRWAARRRLEKRGTQWESLAHSHSALRP